MHIQTATTEACRNYEAAYMEHYKTKDLIAALKLYRGVMASHPDTKEAEYSRMQILNIANSVVPKQEFLDAQIEMALAHLEPDGTDPVTPRASEAVV
ncbi:MAG: hypothetical protein ACP5I1_17895 [Candidatus Hinthialibacter sp.]